MNSTGADPVALVAGIGPGLGAALCRKLADNGYRVAGLARSPEAGERLRQELGADRFLPLSADVGDAGTVQRAVRRIAKEWAAPGIYVHNASGFLMADFLDTEPADFERIWRVTLLGAVHGSRAVLPGMLEAGQGVLVFTGATAGVKAAAGFSAFASAKFALRGLAQSLAREYGPRGIHVAHAVIDGVIWGERARDGWGMEEAGCMHPEDISDSYLHLIRQPRSAWTLELDLRPDVEKF